SLGDPMCHQRSCATKEDCNMRKTVIALLALGLVVAAAPPARAVAYWTETFSYPDGNQAVAPSVTGGNWINFSTGASAPLDIQVQSGVAVGNMSQQPDDNRSFAPVGTSASTYACFHVKIPNPGSAPALNYFAHLKDSGTVNFGARVYVVPMGSSFTFGLSVGNCGAGCTVAQSPTQLSYDTCYMVAIKYAPAGSANLWVNPASELSASIVHNTWSGTVTQAGFNISAFALRQNSVGIPSGTSTWTYKVDNLGVAATFDEACFAGPT